MPEKYPLLYEPTTAITDYIIGVLGLVFGYQIFMIPDSLFHFLWGNCFFAVSIGGLLGGTSHGFGPRFSKLIKTIIWRSTLLFVGITGLLLAMSAATFFMNEKGENAMMVTAGALLIIYFIQINTQDTFRHAVKFYLPLMIISFVGFLVAFITMGFIGALFCSIGLAVSLVASWVQVSGISLHQHFNHNDLFHVIQMLGMYLMYRGGLEIPII